MVNGIFRQWRILSCRSDECLGLVVTRTSSPTAEATSNSVSRVMFALPPSILDWYGWPFRVSLPTSVCDKSGLDSGVSNCGAQSHKQGFSLSACLALHGAGSRR